MIIKNPELFMKLRSYYITNNLPFSEINIFGIRYEQNQKNDIWNDILGIWTYNNCYCWDGTTDPGKHATETKDIGAAHLCLGFHKEIWQIGIHKKSNPNFAHTALVQTGNKVKIWRDKNKNYINDDNFADEDYFGINFHRASKYQDVLTIGNYSAGCQVTRNIKDFEFAITLITNTQQYKNNNNFKFSYMLFDYKELGLS
jgi:hypothetical protein